MRNRVDKDHRGFDGPTMSRAHGNLRRRISRLSTVDISVAIRSTLRIVSPEKITACAVGSHEVGVIFVETIACTLARICRDCKDQVLKGKEQTNKPY